MHPPTFHEKNFNLLKGSAQAAYNLFHQNATPNEHSADGYFTAMDKQVKAYCEKTPGTETVLKNYNTAKTEWNQMKKGHGDRNKVINALHVIATANYVAPPPVDVPQQQAAPQRPQQAAPQHPPAQQAAQPKAWKSATPNQGKT